MVHLGKAVVLCGEERAPATTLRPARLQRLDAVVRRIPLDDIALMKAISAQESILSARP